MVEEKNTIWGRCCNVFTYKIIKNVGLAHGFKTINHVHEFKTMSTWFAHGFYAHGFKPWF